MPIKANLDDVAAQIVHKVALRENRSFSNAASTLIRESWRQRQSAHTTTRDCAADGAPSAEQ